MGDRLPATRARACAGRPPLGLAWEGGRGEAGGGSARRALAGAGPPCRAARRGSGARDPPVDPVNAAGGGAGRALTGPGLPPARASLAPRAASSAPGAAAGEAGAQGHGGAVRPYRWPVGCPPAAPPRGPWGRAARPEAKEIASPTEHTALKPQKTRARARERQLPPASLARDGVVPRPRGAPGADPGRASGLRRWRRGADGPGAARRGARARPWRRPRAPCPAPATPPRAPAGRPRPPAAGRWVGLGEGRARRGARAAARACARACARAARPPRRRSTENGSGRAASPLAARPVRPPCPPAHAPACSL
jgi:hypothetical protein